MKLKRMVILLVLITLLFFACHMPSFGEGSTAINEYNPNGYHSFISESGLQGVKDQDGQIILEPEYRFVDEKYEFTGIILFTDDVVVWGFLDCLTGYVSKQDYFHIYINSEPGCDLMAFDEGGYNGMGFFSRKEQRMIIEPQYNGEYYSEFSSGWAWVMKINNNDPDDFDVFLINESNEKLELEDGIKPLSGFSQGRCRVYSEETMLEGFIDMYGNVVIDLKYTAAWDFDDNGYAKVWDQEDRCWMIDVDGNHVSL